MIMPFFITLVCLVIINFWSYYRGWQAGQQNMIHKMADNPDIMLEAFQKIKDLEIEEEATEVEVETNNNLFYIYNKETKLFLGQGTSLEDAMQIVCERFPNQAFWCDDESTT